MRNTKATPYTSSPVLKDFLYYYEPVDKYSSLKGRELEVKKIVTGIQKRKDRNCLIYGDFGIGKSTIIDMVVSYTANQDMEFVFFCLDINKLLSLKKENLHIVLSELSAFLSKKYENILIIEDFGKILENEFIIDEIYSFVRNSSTSIIAEIDNASDEIFEDSIFNYFSEKLCVDSFCVYDVYDIIKCHIQELADFHEVKISKSLAQWIIYASICFMPNENEPSRSLNTIDKVMACSKIQGHSHVSKKDFFNAFAFENKTFRKMSYIQKYRTAIHEIGHLIIYLVTEDMSEYLPVATTCIPCSGYVGRTYMDADTDLLSLRDNEEFYIHLIAALLGGKISEEIFGLPANGGCSEDLAKANKIAQDMATIYGFVGDQVAANDNSDETCNIGDNIDEDADENLVSVAEFYAEEVLSKARNYAEEVILQHKDLISTVAEELVKKGILTKLDFDKLFKAIL